MPSLTAMPGRLLAAVLQRVEAEVGELGDFLAGGPDAEDAARVLRTLIVGVEVVGAASVAARHEVKSRCPEPRPVNAASLRLQLWVASLLRLHAARSPSRSRLGRSLGSAAAPWA